ncbi:MAG: cobalamin B12-binding domain-containing protein [Deltaproteobacteria bacterium]|nr:cobalamin B12-binding domain-containing protein [Deltaproteobacteria bacterium]
MPRTHLVSAAQTLHEHLTALEVEKAHSVIEVASVSRTLSDLFVELLEPAIYRAGVEVSEGLGPPEVEVATVELVRSAVKRLGQRGPWRAPRGRLAVAATVPGERHDLGLEMVSTLLVRDGWRVRRLGAGLTEAEIVDSLGERPDLVLLSVTLAENVEGTFRLVDRIHAGVPGAKVMVGGLAPRLVPERAARVGADLFAEEARAALATVRATFDRR